METKLRGLKICDIEKMMEFYDSNKFKNIFLFNRFPFSKDVSEKFIRNSWIDKKNIHYAISNSSDEYLGTVSLKNVEYVDRTAEYAIIIKEKFWGQKIGSQATNQILEYGFNVLNLNKVYLNVLANNHRAIALYEKFDFIREGVFKDHIFLSGHYVDLIWYALFRDDFNSSSRGDS